MVDGVPPQQLKAAMRRLPTGVTVVTCLVDGADHAMTASAFTSVSLEPPLVLVCVRRTATFAQAMARAPRWGVSILDDSAEAAARWFATSGRPLEGQMDRFAHRRAESGIALLECSLAQLECDTVNVVPAGDHDIVVGAVTAVALAPGGAPLLYWEGDYHDLAAGGRASRGTPA